MKNNNYFLVKTIITCLIFILILSIYFSFIFLKNNKTKTLFDKKLVFENSFSLIDHNGNIFSETNLFEKPSIVFFGFTHCPEICPTTLYDISRWKEIIGENSKQLNTFFITLDPKRDTQNLLKNYLSNFDNIIGITGKENEIIQFSKSWGVYRKIISNNNNYSLDHTATIFLIDKKKRLQGTISFGENDKIAIKKINNLLKTKL